MKKPRVLVIGEAANPALTSAALVGWSHYVAISNVCDAHLAAEKRNEEEILKAGWPQEKFTSINARAAQGLAWKIALFLRGGKDLGWTTYSALYTLAYPFFEREFWKVFGDRLKAGEFDVVHRILPLSPTTPSFLAKKLAKIGVPFIVGPLNGGVPWPKGFEYMRRSEREWLSYLRPLYKWLPGYRGTRDHAKAIVIASCTTWDQEPERYYDKCIFMPENGIDLEKFPQALNRPPEKVVKISFVGRLVPLKGLDMLLEATKHLIREGKVTIDIIGDGPQMPVLKRIVEKEDLGDKVKLDGWVEHSVLHERLSQGDVFAFPSIREFGGGAVLEAMALGLAPVVLDYAGPTELVPPECGISVKMGTREELIPRLREAIELFVNDPAKAREFGKKSRRHIEKMYTWEAKAEQDLEIYKWVMGQRQDKPDWGRPFAYQAD